MAHPVQITHLTPRIVLAERDAPGEPNVRSTVLLGARFTIVFDTLYSPSDMDGVVDIAQERGNRVLVVNSHADDDHVWGNGAFGSAIFVGHALTRQRFLDPDDVDASLRRRLPENPDQYGTVILRAPDITFTEMMTIDAGDFTMDLYPLPGHRKDCILAHIPQLGVLLGGDTIEDPIPLLDDGPLEQWSRELRAWAERTDVEIVIPSHGPVTDARLLRHNADYLDSLAAGRDDGWRPEPGTPRFYIDAHTRNVARARELMAAAVR